MIALLNGGAILAAEAAPPPPTTPALLQLTCHPDARIAADASRALRDRGYADSQIQAARRFYGASALGDLPASTADDVGTPLMLQLTTDAAPEVRLAALNALRTSPPLPVTTHRIHQLADADADPRVREFAQLILDSQQAPAEPDGEAVAATGPQVTAAAPPPVATWLSQRASGSRTSRRNAPTILQVALEEPEFASEEDAGPALSDGPSSPADMSEEMEPDVLYRPLETPEFPEDEPFIDPLDMFVVTERDAPLGFTGPSSVAPTEMQEDGHFVPVEDRWRIGFPDWDRYDKKFPVGVDYPYKPGAWYDPYNQNVLKGDYPILGQHTFLNFTASDQALFEARALPTPTTPFESTKDAFKFEFFGDPNQFQYNNNTKLAFELNHGNAAFKPLDWNVKLTPVVNQNYLDVEELGVVRPNVNDGTTRYRGTVRLEEYFYEMKLADLSPEYDFMSARAGSQYFQSDFRGFIFADTNRAYRLFGTRFANRDQFNIIYFDQTEKDTNSLLNTFDDRHQNTFIANYYRQDFIFPGYTTNFSYHYNKDGPSFEFDRNGFLVRPDPAGIYQPHEVEAHYFGWAGDGHIERINISHAFYWVVGQDSLNPLAGQRTRISAQMAALELSYDRDWARFRGSFFYASGDDDISDEDATGFDTIFDNPNFAGGKFSFWQRQAIKLFGVNLVQRNSLVPDLRSSKFQGQSNFVNPGLFLINGGVDFDITPKLRLVNNVNYLIFDKTQVLEQFVFQSSIDRAIGTDVSTGIEYRPLLNNNIMILAGVSGFFPATGFKDLYNNFRSEVDPLYSHFLEVTLTY